MRFLAPVALAVATTACFATRNDVRILQGDIFALKAQQAQADSARARQLADILNAINGQLAVLSDSIRDVGERLPSFQGGTRTSFYSIEQQLAQMGELLGQSQQAIARFRADIEERNRELMRQALQQVENANQPAPGAAPGTPPANPPATTGADTSTPPLTMPVPTEGPNTLYQIGRDQIMKGAYSAAREIFARLLTNFPDDPLAPAAQSGIADALGAEGRTAESDSVYRLVFTKWSQAPAASTAMYRLGLSLERQGRIADARALMQQVMRDYPRSDEYTLASEWIKSHP
jgi:TolA-binding protein